MVKSILSLSRVKIPNVQYLSCRKGSFVQTSLGLKDGVAYLVPSMTTWNLTMSYDFELNDHDARFRFAVRNLDDERAPTADRYYGYYADAHQDYGRNYYIDFTLRMQ